MASQPQSYRTYTSVHISPDEPPYEDPPNFAAAPPHFVDSQFTSYYHPTDPLCGELRAFAKAFGERTEQHIFLGRAVTNVARLRDPHNPKKSELYFKVLVDVVPDEWDGIYHTAVEMIREWFSDEEKFPRERYGVFEGGGVEV